jgi:hypothetical protein
VRLRALINREVKVLFGQHTGVSVAGGNCVVERRGGEQPEANSQSINTKMLNSIRPDSSASLLAYGEARYRMPTRIGQGNFGNPPCGYAVRATEGVDRVTGDGMEGSWRVVNEGSRSGIRNGVKPSPEGDRASVRALKRGNARGAKGGRKVEA